VTAGGGASNPAFDGTNIWVPNADENDITVLRASTGAVLKTLTGNGLSLPDTIAFDGERMLVTNNGAGSVSLWKAADLTPVGSFSTGFSSSPLGVCSDGIHFWIALNGTGKVARFCGVSTIRTVRAGAGLEGGRRSLESLHSHRVVLAQNIAVTSEPRGGVPSRRARLSSSALR